MENRVAIIGAGVSGLVACKYSLEKGFRPLVFEAEEVIGGIWTRTIDSTRLQNSKNDFKFADYPWPPSTTDKFPTHYQEYIESYAKHFGLYPYIKFNSKVISLDYVGVSHEEMESWDLWGETGKPFGSSGKWHINVQDTKNCTIELHQAEFVILCIGKFSGLANFPDFSPGKGPEVFNGKVMHAMEYAAMDKSDAAQLITNKKVTVVGSFKSAIDTAVECANANGVEKPCTMVQRSAHWLIPKEFQIIGNIIKYGFFTRFATLLEHKPGESFLLCLLATLLSPLRWLIGKFAELYIIWKLPMKKYGMIPKISFEECATACQNAMLPDKFYDKVEEGSIILMKPQPHSFSFSAEGLILDGKTPVESDIVIFATGYKGNEKIKHIFVSPFFQERMTGASKARNPLYRGIIHPRVPQLGIIGFQHAISNLFASEMRCQWLANFLGGNIDLPNIKEMEKNVESWNNYFLKTGKRFGGSCISTLHVWYCDQLCRDIGCSPKRKKGFFANLFQPHAASDYAGLTPKVKRS
ncbi:LOW QUALITY PROTEIN: FMO-like domain-containing protein [Cephalotus follicularis]|uniref:Flavin-containing monooxygenase n=1 Tax=Cephalotus follicularis TaxID=3775 RepID=A0A1Q3C0W6_CEPFO|nr:LOW QUALITY PROTEIN: FMO-like domain-containing protein [Cephalotus follicularis]